MTKTTKTTAAKCEALTKAGKPCKCNAVKGSIFCATHGKDVEAMSRLPVHAERKAAAVALLAQFTAGDKADKAMTKFALRMNVRFQWMTDMLADIGEGSHWSDAKGLAYRLKQQGGAGDNIKPMVTAIATAYADEQKASKALWEATRKTDSNKNRLFYLVRKAAIAQVELEAPEPAAPTTDEVQAKIDADVKAAIFRTARKIFALTNDESCSSDALAVYASLTKTARLAGIELSDIEAIA
tara:strand:- start:5764 stop:6483 length:720 start_codon:yes stop_codon:yes gene_type:complete